MSDLISKEQIESSIKSITERILSVQKSLQKILESIRNPTDYNRFNRKNTQSILKDAYQLINDINETILGCYTLKISFDADTKDFLKDMQEYKIGLKTYLMHVYYFLSIKHFEAFLTLKGREIAEIYLNQAHDYSAACLKEYASCPDHYYDGTLVDKIDVKLLKALQIQINCYVNAFSKAPKTKVVSSQVMLQIKDKNTVIDNSVTFEIEMQHYWNYLSCQRLDPKTYSLPSFDFEAVKTIQKEIQRTYHENPHRLFRTHSEESIFHPTQPLGNLLCKINF